MRELKFRMFVVDKMVYRGIYDKNWYLHTSEAKIFRSIDQSDKKYPIMQYIGLKDKNGKEIYEGDIVVFEDWKPKIVVYKDKYFACFTLKDTLFFINDYDAKNMEIIGNIYENPELLENK